MIALCGSSPDINPEPKSNWFVMHNKLLVLEFQSREPKSYFTKVDQLSYGVELELVCSNSTRNKVQKTKTSSQKYFFTFQSVDNFDQTPGYEFENNDFYEKDSFQHISPTQERLRSFGLVKSRL